MCDHCGVTTFAQSAFHLTHLELWAGVVARQTRAKLHIMLALMLLYGRDGVYDRSVDFAWRRPWSSLVLLYEYQPTPA